MKKQSPILIILRGNSGSGKSSVAKILREKIGGKTALVEQDYLRRIILKQKEKTDGDDVELIKLNVKFALRHGYNVILEGILYSGRYKKMLRQLIKLCPNHSIYYFDISLEETLKRHVTKPNSDEFGEKELREWYKAKDVLGFKGEKIIPEKYTMLTTINEIIRDKGI